MPAELVANLLVRPFGRRRVDSQYALDHLGHGCWASQLSDHLLNSASSVIGFSSVIFCASDIHRLDVMRFEPLVVVPTHPFSLNANHASPHAGMCTRHP